MILEKFEKFVGTGAYTGFLPFATGTWGSLAALLIYLTPGFESPYIMSIFILVFFVWGLRIADSFEVKYGKDPKQCTIDEFVGMWISLFLVPKTILWVTATFFVWRFFDIVKPFPANRAEKIKGGTGIMLDDVISGFYTAVLMQLIIHFNDFWNILSEL